MTISTIDPKRSASNGSELNDGVAPRDQDCRALIDRLTRTDHFSRAPRLRNLLLYIANESLKHGSAEIKEHDIGVNVFGRAPSYDPGQDNIVRVNASELRRRLESYFAHEGAHEPLIVEVPRGAYRAVFRKRELALPLEPAPALEPKAPQLPIPLPAEPTQAPPVRRLLPIVLASLGVVLLIGCCALWLQVRTLRATLYPWKSSPALTSLWANFIDSAHVTDVIPGDQGFLLVEQVRNQQISFEAYQNRSFMTALPGPPGMDDVPHIASFVFGKNLVSTNDCVIITHILALDPKGKSVFLYNSRHYSVDLMKRDNLIIIGGPFANPWDQLFETRLNFVEKADLHTPGSVEFVNGSPKGTEQKTYPQDREFGYGMVAFLPNPAGDGNVLLIQGTDPEATEAAAEFLLSEDQLGKFLATIQRPALPYFEALLKVSRVHGSSPISSTVQAYRTYQPVR